MEIQRKTKRQRYFEKKAEEIRAKHPTIGARQKMSTRARKVKVTLYTLDVPVIS